MPASDKIALFIDGANLNATAKTLGSDIDYKRLLQEFQSRGTLVRAFYYTTIVEDPEYSAIRPLVDWLDGWRGRAHPRGSNARLLRRQPDPHCSDARPIGAHAAQQD